MVVLTTWNNTPKAQTLERNWLDSTTNAPRHSGGAATLKTVSSTPTFGIAPASRSMSARSSAAAIQHTAASAQAGFASANDRLGAICQLELVEDAGDVIAHRFGTQVQPLGDLGVFQSLGHQLQDFVFALRQLRK